MSESSAIRNSNVFKGKIVILYLKNVPDAFSGGIVIRNPEIEEFCRRLFVVGEVPSGFDWSSGQRAGIAFDQIIHFLEYADEEDFIKKVPRDAHRISTGLNA